MTIRIEIPEPLAAEVSQAAQAQAKSAHDFVLEILRKTLESTSPNEEVGDSGSHDPLLGLLSSEPDLATFIEESAMHAREARPLRAASE
jgi:hypothetical protein